jgi:HAD superfamily hydrolase (TIGR01484 family)
MQPEKQALVAHIIIPTDSIFQIISATKQRQTASLFIYTVDPEAKFINNYSSTESVFYVGDREKRPEVDFNGMPVLPYEQMNMFSNKVVAALISVRDAEEKIELLQALMNVPGVSITSSGSIYIEIRPRNSSKALGIKVLCDRYKILPQNVIAVGDNDNDVELLSWAGISVCVSNSSPAARAASKFYSNQGAGNAAIEILEIVRRAQRLFGRARKA